ncbi:MAG: CU044_5270 family protein [Actinomycetota bacterium]|nr:CU044_5270 family protein [Actinomycetota bacterium]MDQ2957470.1 CU044_5270 family protein [Actinomycetota bacterium]
MIDIDELTNLRSQVPAMTDEVYERGLHRIEAAMFAGPQRHRSHRSRYALVAAVAVAAVLTTGIVAIGQHAPSDAASAEILRDAATHALAQPVLHPRRGQFVYKRIAGLGNGRAFTAEYWIPADGSGRETICRTNGNCTVLSYDKTRPQDQAMPYDVLSSLPTSGPAMLARLRADPSTVFESSHGKSPDLAVWYTVFNLADLLPPAQQAALFKAVASLHSVRVEGRATTFDGRAGVALGVHDPVGSDLQLIFTPDTHAYLGERAVQEFASFNTSLSASVVVDKAKQRP